MGVFFLNLYEFRYYQPAFSQPKILLYLLACKDGLLINFSGNLLYLTKPVSGNNPRLIILIASSPKSAQL